MEFWKLLLLVVVVADSCCIMVHGFGQVERDSALDYHNTKRSEEKGCCVNALTYDMDLESQAEAWAQSCVFKHEGISGRGENLAKIGGNKDDLYSIERAMKLWWNEISKYNSSEESCGQACHYTQMVWGKTSRIGCYSQNCDSWRFVVCFYTPSGNCRGVKAIEKECETPCRDGKVASNWLCYEPNATDNSNNSDPNPNLTSATSPTSITTSTTSETSTTSPTTTTSTTTTTTTTSPTTTTTTISPTTTTSTTTTASTTSTTSTPSATNTTQRI